ncbi:hypothetical protein BH23GEM11_BH23GEM11_19710 [soil metagenome]
MTPVDPRLGAPLGVVSRRLVLLAGVNGALGGLVVATVGLVAWVLAQPVLRQGAFPGGGRAAAAWMVGGMLLGMGISLNARFRARRRNGGRITDAARKVESTVPTSRNVVLTAAEFPRAPVPMELRVADAIVADAATLLEENPPGTIVPLLASGISLAGFGALATGVLLLVATMSGDRLPSPGLTGWVAANFPVGDRSGEMTEMEVVVRVVPPAYAGDSARVYRNPDRVEALQGSRLELVVRVQGGPSRRRTSGIDLGERVVLETMEGHRDLRNEGSGEYLGEMNLEADGFLALEHRAAVSGAAGGDARPSRRLIGLGAMPDLPPSVRISAPGQDLYLPDGNRVLELEVEASDDRALRSLELLFTTVSGFGELFEFREGSIPLEITRQAPDRWTARARWDLAELQLDRGDIVVYRAIAHDRRPEALPGESDTWTVEILGSEAAPSGGFAGEDELTRYGLSQQMVLVLTERLREQRPTLSAERLADEISMLAAAQRRVRAEFVFMLGGELEDGHDHPEERGGVEPDHDDHDDDHDGDAGTAQELHEEAHARADADAAEGRLAQAGRIELARAIQAMSQAVSDINAVDLDAALASETLALEYLQRAFSNSRYLLRALSEREELDPGRRLSGERGSAVADRRPQVEVRPDDGTVALREILGQVILLASGAANSPESSRHAVRGDPGVDPPGGASADASALAARLLAVDPGSETLQRLSSSLSGDRSGGIAGASAREGLLDVVTELSRYLRGRHAPHPGTPSAPGLTHMEGAWAEALRRAGEGDR